MKGTQSSSLDCKHNHMLLKMELHLTNLVSFTVLQIEFHDFNHRIDDSGLLHCGSWY